MIIIKTDSEIEEMAKAGMVVAKALELAAESIKPGLKTITLDEKIENLIRDNGGTPAFKGYRGFPASICSSLNDEVVHGIPGQREMQSGDIISIDVGVKLGDFYADAAYTYPVGDVDGRIIKLLETTKACLQAGISKCRPGNRLTDISHEVQVTAETNGFSVVRDFVGHGIGRRLHEEPQIMNYGEPGLGPVLEQGMVLAIEPMINAGGYGVKVEADGWTVRTRDGKLSAHFEHTVAIDQNGPIILTKS